VSWRHRDTFEEAVATDEEDRDEHPLDHPVLSDDHLLDLDTRCVSSSEASSAGVVSGGAAASPMVWPSAPVTWPGGWR
jgi:hypothetical protein